MKDQKKELIKYGLAKSYSTLNEIDELLKLQFISTAINRLYYSWFHAVNAILSLKGISSKTHKGTLVLLYQHIVNEGILTGELGKFYKILFKARQENDYDDFINPDPLILPEWRQKAKEFIDTLNEYILKIIDK